MVLPDGTWQCAPVAPLPDGLLTLTPATTDSAGIRLVGTPVSIVIDAPAPLFTTQPSGCSTIAGSSAVFTAEAGIVPGLALRWQTLCDGGAT